MEDIEKVEETEIEETPVEETEVEVKAETEEPVEEAETEVKEPESEELLHNILSGVLTAQMGSVEDIKTLVDNAEFDEAKSEVLAEIREDINRVVGKLQAVLGFENEDNAVAEEAKEETEEKLADEAEKVEETEEETVEVIEPIDDEVEEVSEDEVEEVEETEEDKEDLGESVEVSKTFGIEEFEPWGPAEDNFDYIRHEVGYEGIDKVLEDQFGQNAVIDETSLNDFFAYYYIDGSYLDEDYFYELFGVKNPYSDDIEEVEEEETEEVEVDESCEEAKNNACHKMSLKEYSDFDDDIDEVEADDDDIREINKEMRRNKRLADLKKKHKDKVDYRRGDMKRHFFDDDISEDEI